MHTATHINTQMLASWELVTDLPAALRPACSLELLLHSAPKLRSLVQGVLERGAAGSDGEALDCLGSCPGALHVSTLPFHCFPDSFTCLAAGTRTWHLN